ncbi:two-component system response regulator [Mesorhizobium loti]|uniref:Regulatory protein VirG n=1 Tax=Rhizobium loti TaxID=381 RepID=A0A117N2J9_RHILI|nr:two-component system response regulator [Mesorhizobium loti]
MSDLILLIEDDRRLAGMVSDFLKQTGFVVEHTLTGEEGLVRLARGGVSAIVLDLMLPGIDGLEVCRRARVTSDSAILMLTARGDETDRVVGLELGADDYLPKPFSPRELVARLRAILRRRNAGPRQQELLCFGPLEIDPEARRLRVYGVEQSLTSYQFDLLVVLARHAGRVLSRDQIMDLVKGEPLEAFDRSIDVHISRIRAAIEKDPRRPKQILTIRGVGYLFARHHDWPEKIE